MNTKFAIGMMLVLGFTFFSCSKNSDNTPERNYYVEIRLHQDDQFSNELSRYLATRIPQKKYTITNRSGLTWPYYVDLDLSEDIPKDSLMPPHWFIHKMILGDSTSLHSSDEHLVRIDLMTLSDTISNYMVRVYESDSLGLVLSASSGIHFIDTTEFSSRDHLYDHFLKSIIRYSFK